MMLLTDMWRRFLFLFTVPPVRDRAVLLLREKENDLLDARLSLSAYRQHVKILEDQVKELRSYADSPSTGADVVPFPTTSKVRR